MSETCFKVEYELDHREHLVVNRPAGVDTFELVNHMLVAQTTRRRLPRGRGGIFARVIRIWEGPYGCNCGSAKKRHGSPLLLLMSTRRFFTVCHVTIRVCYVASWKMGMLLVIRDALLCVCKPSRGCHQARIARSKSWSRKWCIA